MSPSPILGVGHVSNVGLTFEGTCAAFRAGISRTRAVSGTEVYDPDTLGAPVQGAAIPSVTHGFFQSGRWIQLAIAALDDLARSTGVASAADIARGAHVIWILPYFDDARFRIAEGERAFFLDAFCRDTLRDVAALEVADAHFEFLHGGAATAEAVHRAREIHAKTPEARVILVATDSWLDPLSLTQLIDEGRLKCAENPAGMTPGECGVAVLLGGGLAADVRSEVAASSTGLDLQITEAALEDPENPASALRSALAPELGKIIHRAAVEALERAGAPQPFEGALLVDLNGEPWKSVAWGHALVPLQGVIHPDATFQVPAESFGDIGAASGLASLSLASHALQRSASPGDMALTITIDDRMGVAVTVSRTTE